MRKYCFAILFIIVLVTPFVLRLAMGVSSAQGSGSGKEQLIIFTSHLEPIRREFADAFSEWHRKRFGTGVFIDYRVLGSNDIVKYFDASKDSLYAKLHTYQADLVWGGGDYVFDQQLKKRGYLQGVKLDPALMKGAFPKPDLNGVALYDTKSDPPQWFGAALSSFGIAYNRDVDRYLKVADPQTWADLADPRYMGHDEGGSGWLVAADPTQSGSARQAYVIIVEKAMLDAKAKGESEDHGWARGMGLIRQISANCSFFTDSSGVVPQLIGSGNAAAGMTIDFYGRTQAESVGDRMRYVDPVGATAINPDPIAMVAGAEHEQLAKQFISFVLSRQGQLLWNTRAGVPGGPVLTSLRRLPIRPDVYTDMSNFTDQVNPFTGGEGFRKSIARERTQSIIGYLIEASCIDLLIELRDTRAAILRSSRAAELDARLGTFPFDQPEALRRQAEYAADTPLRRVDLMERWTEQFRKEYRALRAEADAAPSQTASRN